jgi:hypothetical protein
MLLVKGNSETPLYALHVVLEKDNLEETNARGKKLMAKAKIFTDAVDLPLIPINRVDLSVSNAVVFTIKEYAVRTVLLGMHHEQDEIATLGEITGEILSRTSESIFIVQLRQPLNTLKRMIVVVPAKAELEPGFFQWFHQLVHVSQETGSQLHFYAEKNSLRELQELFNASKKSLKVFYHEFDNWSDILYFMGVLKQDDLFVLLMSRRGYPSHIASHDKIPYYLKNYFRQTGYILLFPEQVEHGLMREHVQYVDSKLAEGFVEGVSGLGKVGKDIGKWFRNK